MAFPPPIPPTSRSCKGTKRVRPIVAMGMFLVAVAGAGAPSVKGADGETPDNRRSGYDDMGQPIRTMQDDDMANPANLWSEDGKTFYRLRAEHECINAHARRMGLRQLSLRGKLKARIHLLWFAVAHNMTRFLALQAKAQAAA